jgi:outer membrane receptor protein involved in Fe transport
VATVRGVVLDRLGQPIANATVRLTDPAGATVTSTPSDNAGAFRLTDIAPGAYTIRVEVGGTIILTRALVVRGSLPIELTLRAGPTVHEEVLVQGDATFNAAENPATLAGDAVRGAAEAIPSQRVQAALASLPGWSAEDNGLLHVRGVDDGVLYVQDGIPVYERLDRLFGLPPNPPAIDSLHIIDGYVPPEFGFKAGAVVVTRSISGMRGAWTGSIDGGIADRSTTHVQGFAAGPLGRSAALMTTASSEWSGRFLDPIDLDNFHNEGRTMTAAAQLTWLAGPGLFSSSIQGGLQRYQVSNTLDQQAAGQDQQQHADQLLFSASWQQSATDRTVWQVSTYVRHGSSALLHSPFDTPLAADTQRTNDRYGALWSANHQRGRHAIKFGGEASTLVLDERFSFVITDLQEAVDADLSDAALEHTPDNPFTFADHQRPWLLSLFAQDAVQASDRLTINFGARFDRSRLLIDAWQLSPRAGVAYVVRPGTTVRASAMRLFQPPQTEYLLLSSSPEARELSPFVDDDEIGGGSTIPPERQTALDVSVTQDVTDGWRVEASAWHRRGRDVDDPNVFAGTTIVFPNSVARQLASGVDVGVTMLPRHGWSGSASYTHARVVQFGPVTGGLFLEDEVAEIKDGTKFIPDHDQRHGLFVTAGYTNERHGWRVSGAFRYQTGTPLGIGDVDEDLLTRRGAETIDVESGRVRPRAIVDVQAELPLRRTRAVDVFVRLWTHNLTNDTYAFNFGNPFSGTHFGAPRRVGASVRIGFKHATN